MSNWKKIPNFPYEVSDMGEIRNAKGKTLKPRIHTNGYQRVQLCSDGTQREEYIHTLVCEAFCGPRPDTDWEVDHINGDRADNRSDNLRWITITANRERRNLVKGINSPHAKLTEDDVRRIKSTPRHITSDKTMAMSLSVARETVRDIRNGKGWKHVTI